MDGRTDGSLLLRNTMRIEDGHLDAFRQAIRDAVDFAAQHGPQLMVQTFIDEERMLAFSYQLYGDSDAVLRHWRIADPHIARVMAHCTVVDLQVHGAPEQPVLDGLDDMIRRGIARVTPRLAGFVRGIAGD